MGTSSSDCSQDQNIEVNPMQRIGNKFKKNMNNSAFHKDVKINMIRVI